MEAPNLDLIRRLLQRFRERLTNYTRKNKELYFKEGALSFNLTKHPFPNLLQRSNPDDPIRAFDGLRSGGGNFAALIDSGSLDLGEHLRLGVAVPEELVESYEGQRARVIKSIDKIRRADRNFQREYGLSGAWLLGPFLCWRSAPEYHESDIVISPIFRIPIDIEVSKKREWKLLLEDQDLTVNPSLRLFLRQSWGIELPERVEEENPEDALSKIIEIISKEKTIKWAETDEVPTIPPRTTAERDEDGEVIGRKPVVLEEVLREDELAIYRGTTSQVFQLVDVFSISQINASKMALVEDYDKILENVGEHPIVNELLLGQPIKADADSRPSPKELDTYRESTNHFVVGIDSTQHAAVSCAGNLRAVAIEGPPGTGKSQTITNLIADKIAAGNKVLFVSEKRAALDVVYTRLKKAEIADQAVLIHSSDLQKQELYQSFIDLADCMPTVGVNKEWDRLCIDLDNAKTVISEYRDALGIRHEGSGLTLSEILSLRASVSEAEPDLAITNYVGEISFDNLKRIKDDLNSLQEIVSRVPDYQKHEWLFKKSKVVNTASFKAEFRALHDELVAACNSLKEAFDELKKLLPGYRSTAVRLINREKERLAGLRQLDERGMMSVVELSKILDVWAKTKDEFQTSLSTVKANSETYSLFSDEVRLDHIKKLDEYWSEGRGVLDWFSKEFWRKRKLKQRVLATSEAVDDSTVYAQYIDYHQNYESVQKKLGDLGFVEIPAVGEDETLENLVERCLEIGDSLLVYTELKAQLGSEALSVPNSDLRVFRESLDRLASANEVAERVSVASEKISSLKNAVGEYFTEELKWTNDELESSALTERLLGSIEDLDLLDAIDGRFAALDKTYELLSLKTFILANLIERPLSWGDYVYSHFLLKWSDEVKTEHLAIRRHDPVEFEKALQRFRELEDRHRELARGLVTNKWASSTNGVRDSQGVRLLKKEAGKKRKVLTPREIMERGALDAMLALKPCWLMSPLSISQLLPLKMGLFDIIIFDEASQVRVEDSIPSIFRAEKLVVVGDRKQMPPTNFFSGVADDDDDEDEEEIPESILDLALQIYPDVLLEWHYRSKAEALIAFSNRAFYGGRLIAVPNPQLLTDGNAVEFVQLKDAYFTQKYGNRVEAQAVVQRVKALLEENDSRSVGVMAFGQGQMKTIESVLDEEMDADPSFKRLIEKAINQKDGEADIGFFIKNLENVQGDERDVIVVSVGYAPSRPGKKLYKNFGPLSKTGGGRRLNVAVTRAKEKIVVFSSFSPDEIATDEEAFAKNPDASYFGRYLKYARAVSENNLDEVQAILDSFPMGGAATSRKPTRFNLDVKRRLEERGYKVSTEIGTCGYFIDLGVHHPVDERKYALGIECDGATFHSTQYARDRDKIREELLCSRGWKIERIGSIEWSKDWTGEVERIEKRLQEILPRSIEVTEGSRKQFAAGSI